MAKPLVFLLILTTPWALLATPIGTLVALEGEVSVLRAGVIIPSEKVAEGFALEPFDTVSTGVTGRADARFNPVTGLTGTVRLDPETMVYFEMTTLKAEQTGAVELVSGSVTARLTALAGASALEVRTDLGSFLGKTPGFRVVQSALGDALVTTTAGRVLCRIDNRTVSAEPGAVVEALALEHIVQTIPVNVSTLDSFEGSWTAQRRQALRDQAAVAFRVLASRFQLQAGFFQRAWERVQREAGQDARGAATANLRRALTPLERSLPRMRSLRKLLDEGLIPASLELTRGYVAKDFFRQFAADDPVLTSRVAQARALFGPLADAFRGTFPRAADGSSVTWDSDFFH